MKIIHPSGKAYHLSPNTQLEIERPNLFFNDYGEQSLPVDLPDSEHNRALMGYPDQLANRKKPDADIVCTLQDGDYSVQARQAILSAKRNDHISTSFYLNDGAFLSKLNNVSLKEVFGDECIPDVTTINQGISFCRSLYSNTHEQFGIFPIYVDDGTTDDDGNPLFKCLNRYGYTNESGTFYDGVSEIYSSDFYNAQARIIQEGDNEVSLGIGYYITPFIRANYLLKRILEHFGYVLLDNFFTSTEPFNKMVFVNTTADSLINGKIRLTDLLPDVNCNDILEFYRTSFFCEFVVDEIAKTVTIELFNDVLLSEPSVDVTPYKTDALEISYPEEYKQLCIKYSEKVSYKGFVEGEKTLAELGKKYPNASENDVGGYSRSGWQYRYNTLEGPSVSYVQEVVSPASMPYQEHNEMTVEVKEIPAMLPELYEPFKYSLMRDSAYLFAGEIRWLNSVMVLATSMNEEADAATVIESKASNGSMPIIPSFVWLTGKMCVGTINDWAVDPNKYWFSEHVWDYSLCPTGRFGLYNQFYKKYDALLRNSLHKVTVSLLLPVEVKSTLPAHKMIMLDNQKMFVNKLHYALGGDESPMETELYTSRLYEPINIAKPLSAYQQSSEYSWEPHCTIESATVEEYDLAEEKASGYGFNLEPIFPILPLAEYVGKKFYQRTIYNTYTGLLQAHHYVKLTYWLECVKTNI